MKQAAEKYDWQQLSTSIPVDTMGQVKITTAAATSGSSIFANNVINGLITGITA